MLRGLDGNRTVDQEVVMPEAEKSKERFVRALYADEDQERLVNFKLFPGTDRDTTAEDVYEAVADAITKERLGMLKEIDFDDEERDFKDFTVKDIERI